jgi:hypothetical protein
LKLECEYNGKQCYIERAIEVHEYESDVSGCNLAGLGNEADPQVVFKLLIEETHLRVGVFGVVLHCHVVDALGAVAETTRNTENLLAGTLPILLLILF